MIDEDMKIGYNIGCQRLNEEIDTMINELHNAYMNHTNKEAKDRMDAQIKILWSFKSRIEDAIVDSIKISKDEQPKADWIPCEVETPKKNGVYQTVRKVIEGDIVYYLEGASYFDGQNIWHNDIGVNHGREYPNVVAWQPILPYKKEGAE